MASEIRVNQIQNRSGLTTTTLNDQGVVVAGIVTANSFSGDITGNVTGNITGDVTGNTAGHHTGGVTGNVNAPSGISTFGGLFVTGTVDINAQTFLEQLSVSGVITATAGNPTEGSFLKGTSVGIGTTTTAGRNAGVSTANGTLIYNSSLNQLEVYANNQWQRVVQKEPFAVSGGTISNDVNRAAFVTHTFTSPGNFVTAGQITSAEIFVIGGGGGGGSNRYGAGGGAGGAMLATGVTLDSGTYSVAIGSGGNGGSPPAQGTDGGNTIFGPGGPQQRQGTGGGGGGSYDGGSTGRSGGCGGGAGSRPPSSGGSATQPSAPGPGTDYGFRGGNYNTPGGGWAPAGGGGTAAQGVDSPGDRINGGGNGGPGVQLSISGTATYYGGGGGAAVYNTINPSYPPATPQEAPANHKTFGGDGGGGTGGAHPAVTIPPNSSPNQHGLANTGSGGAGAHSSSENFSTSVGGNGGSGLVIVAYPSNDNAVVT